MPRLGQAATLLEPPDGVWPQALLRDFSLIFINPLSLLAFRARREPQPGLLIGQALPGEARAQTAGTGTKQNKVFQVRLNTGCARRGGGRAAGS